jgi:hypothetical protein
MIRITAVGVCGFSLMPVSCFSQLPTPSRDGPAVRKSQTFPASKSLRDAPICLHSAVKTLPPVVAPAAGDPAII